MKSKKILFIVITFLISILWNNYSYGTSLNATSPAAILVNTNTGKVMYEKNAHQTMYPASTTKMMTAILALENCDLTDTAVVSQNAVILPEGYLGDLQVGEEVSIDDLLHLLLIVSSNDAAVVLAEHIAGTVSNFANMMNAKANEIGCLNTHFVNPNGVHNANHYTTAYDLYLIAQYAMKNDTFREIVSYPVYTMEPTNKSGERILENTNMLLHEFNIKNKDEKNKYYYEYAIGIKTGYTTSAKNCLVSAAKKDDVEYIAVVLGSDLNETPYYSQRFDDSKNLFLTAFDTYSFYNYKNSKDIITNIEIQNGNYFIKNLDLALENDIVIFMNKNDIESELTSEIVLDENKISGSIAEGDVLGTVTFVYDGVSYTGNLLATKDVYSKEQINLYIQISVGIIIMIIILFIICKKTRKK